MVTYAENISVWVNESTTTCGAGGLNFPARSGKRQEDVSTLIVELAILPRRDAKHPVCMARIKGLTSILFLFACAGEDFIFGG